MANRRAARRLPQSAAVSLASVLLVLQACGRPEDGGAPRKEPGAVKQVEIPQSAGPVALATGEVHFRDFSLASGEALHVVVEQQGIDVALLLRDPQGQEILKVDSPNGRYGPEEILQIADLPGPYRVEIHGSEPAEDVPEGGRYLLREAAHRPAQPQDREWIAGDRLDREGRRLARDGAWTEAIERFSRAREVWKRLGLHSREAEALRQLGVAWQQSGDLPAARDAWDRTLSWYRGLGEGRKSFLLHDLGKLELRLGEAETAIGHLEEAHSLFEQEGEEQALISALSALGTAWRMRGFFQRALDCLETATEHSHRMHLPGLEADVQIDRAALLLDLDRTTEALAGYQRALELYRSLADPEGVSLAQRGVADVDTRTGSLVLAEKAARDAIAVLGAGGPSRARAAALSSLGRVRRKKGDWKGARQAFEEALALARTGRIRRDEAVLLTELAYAVTQGGEPLHGLELYDEALRIFREIGSRNGEAMVQARSAEALRDLGRLDEAWQRLEPALRIIEGLRAATNRQDYRLSYFGSRQGYYEIAVDVLLGIDRRQPRAGYASRAFEVHERQVARELLEALVLTDRSQPPADPALLVEEKRLERTISELAGQPASGEDERLAGLVDDLQRVRGRIRAAAPEEKEAVATVDLDTVRKHLLDEDSLALVYALGENRSHLFAISRQSLRVHALPGRALLESKAHDFLAALQRADKRTIARQASLGKELGELLLAPADDLLASKKRLILVADGTLQDLPFAALVLPEKGDRPLVESHEIVNLPSLSMLARSRSAEAHRPTGTGRLGIFGDPVFGPDGEPSSMTPYRRLPGSLREVEAVQALWQDTGKPFVAVGFEASREALLQNDWSGFEMLYFATHAVGHRLPGLSGLVLSLRDPQGRPQPGFVTGLEISRLSLPVDLVVLSACETASGGRMRGEGTLGLSWSFLQAGAARVVATLWKVDDRRTADLMTRFLELVHRDGLPPSAALQRAQREALGRPGALPRDWAGFVFIGDWRRNMG